MNLMKVFQMDCGLPEPKTMTIKVSEIKKVIDLAETNYVKNYATITDEFVRAYEKYLDSEDEHHSLENINDFAETCGVKEFQYCSDQEESYDCDIIGSTWNGLEKYNLTDLDEEEMYTWHDGSNWKNEFLNGENGWQEIVEYDEDEIDFLDLDESDGSDLWTCNKFYHVKIGKMKDGNYITDEYSQFQGSHGCGKLLEGDDALKEYLEEIDRLDRYDQMVSR